MDATFGSDLDKQDVDDDSVLAHMVAQFNRMIDTANAWDSLERSAMSGESTRVADLQSTMPGLQTARSRAMASSSASPIPVAASSPPMSARSVTFGSSDYDGRAASIPGLDGI